MQSAQGDGLTRRFFKGFEGGKDKKKMYIMLRFTVKWSYQLLPRRRGRAAILMPGASVMPMEGLTATPVEGSRGGFRNKWGKMAAAARPSGPAAGPRGPQGNGGPDKWGVLEPCPHVGAKAETSTNWDETNCSPFFVCQSNSYLYPRKPPRMWSLKE